MAENLEESQPRKEKKKWKALLFGVGAFLLFKGLGLLKWLWKPIFGYLGLTDFFDSFSEVLFLELPPYILLYHTCFLLLFIPLTRFYARLYVLYIVLRKFNMMVIFSCWVGIIMIKVLNYGESNEMPVYFFLIGFPSSFLFAYPILCFQVLLYHLYGRLWRIIAQKRRTI
jgi:hypothetical protein